MTKQEMIERIKKEVKLGNGIELTEQDDVIKVVSKDYVDYTTRKEKCVPLEDSFSFNKLQEQLALEKDVEVEDIEQLTVKEIWTTTFQYEDYKVEMVYEVTKKH